MSVLSFTNPGLVWGAAAVALPVAIHLLSRRRSRRLPFAAVEFILRSRKEKVRQVRLKQLILLAMRMLVLLALALALARPLLKDENAVASSNAIAAVALVVDASLSMRAKLDSQSLFEHARKEAGRLLDALPPESPATVVVCDGRPPSADAPSFDRAALRHQLDDAQPSYRPADLSSCLAAGARALGESPLEGKKIYVFGDLTTPSLRLDSAPPRVPTPAGDVAPEVTFVDAADGAEIPNVGIVDLAVDNTAELGTRGYAITATLRNSGNSEAKNVAVSLRVAGQVVVRGFADVPARSTTRKTLVHRFDPGPQLVDVLLAPDALAEDDVRSFVLPVSRDVRALVVDGAPSAVRHRDEAFFVEAALSAERTGGRIAPVFLDADAAQSKTLSDFDAVLLLNLPTPKTAFVAALRTFVQAGGGLFISLGDQVNAEDYSAAFGDLLPRPLHLLRTAAEPDDAQGPPPAHFARVDVTHPALTSFDTSQEGFDSTRIYRYFLLRPDAVGDERVLAALDDGSPILIEAQRGAGRVVLFTSTVDRDWTDWPIRTSFLPAMQQLVEYVGGGLGAPPRLPSIVGAGRPVPVLPKGSAVESVLGADGRAVRIEAGSIATEIPGHYRVNVRDGAGVRQVAELAFAVAVDPSESDTTRLARADLDAYLGREAHASIAGSADAALPASATPLWTWLLLALVTAFAVEGALVRRG